MVNASNKIITRKSELQKLLAPCLLALQQEDLGSALALLEQNILNQKVKFPLLELAGRELHQQLAERDQLVFCDRLAALHSEGGNVIIGMILQCRIPADLQQSITKAAEYIAAGEKWYVSDIIGERVSGWALWKHPAPTLAMLSELSRHPSIWVLRSIGSAVHFATKRGLEAPSVVRAFEILLRLANHKEKQVKTGIGWAAKTAVKFHPQLAELYREEIQNQAATGQWFRSKVKTGLARYEYAKGNRS